MIAKIEQKLHMSGYVEIVDSSDNSNIKLFSEEGSASLFSTMYLSFTQFHGNGGNSLKLKLKKQLKIN